MTNSALYQRFQFYTVEINQRPFYQGVSLPSRSHTLNGQLIVVLASWFMGDHDVLPNEWALTPVGQNATELFTRAGIIWIASGDVKYINNKPDNEALKTLY